MNDSSNITPPPQPSPSKGEGTAAIISAIAAIGANRELGKNNQLLWRIPEDLKRFRELTAGHPVIMGRKTYESIGRALPGRTNIIITRQADYKAQGCIVVGSVEEAIAKAKEYSASSAGKDQEEIFIIGGGQVYQEAMPWVDKLYLTIVAATAEADVFFPDYSEFSKVVKQEAGAGGGCKLTFLELEKGQ